MVLSFKLADHHVALRRHSFSAPAGLALYSINNCVEGLKELSVRVTRLTRRAQEERLRQVREKVLLDLYIPGQNNKSRSIGDLRFPDPSPVIIAEQLLDEILITTINSMSNSKSDKVRVCHQCHAPLSDEVHIGVPSGVGRCPLEHWLGCKGDITSGMDKNSKVWSACPTMVSSDSETGSELELEVSPTEKVPGKLPCSVEMAAAGLEKALGSTVEDELQPSPLYRPDDVTTDSSEDDELISQREELKQLQREIDQQAVANKAAEKTARREERRRKLAQEKVELARQTKILREQQVSLSAQSSRVSAQLPNLLGTAAGTSVPTSTGTRAKDLKDKVAEHEAKKARKAASKLAQQQQNQGGGMTMGGIRALPDVRQEVEEYIMRLKAIVPTLASDPTAVGFTSSTFQPEGVHSGSRAQTSENTKSKKKYIYVAELGQVIPIVDSLNDLPAVAAGTTRTSRPIPDIQDSPESDSECSEDEDCQVEPESGMRFAWKRHSNGNKFFKPVPIHGHSSEMKVTYQLDETTGNYEKIMVPKQQLGMKKPSTKVNVKTVATTATPQYKDHRVASSKGSRAGVPIRKEERQSSFVSSDPDKQGKESRLPSLVQFARDCPVSWTNKVTTSGLNPVLFSWAYVAELLATRSGQVPSLQAGELEARLQHFLSVLEVTLQTTVQTDFASDSWKVARLYHQKVQDKVDSGVYDWLELSQQWGTATLPHELMAANAELATKDVKKSPPKKRGAGNAGDKRRGDTGDKADDKKLCSSWNNSDTRGKCKWEVENEGRKCNFLHICSWCKTEHSQTNFHQKVFCKKRQEKEGE